jgi:insulysin
MIVLNRLKSTSRHFLTFCLPLFGFSVWLGGADLPDRHPLDESEYRRFILDNGLKVILLSDSKLNKSSASMVVGVGSLGDPEERPGLAHFLEHMLFLGTEKFPNVEDYGGYLRSNGGYSNAYTAGDHTNYHFEVSHHAFEGAIDRFAQFFISPLFAQEFTEREMNAVNSEHQKNVENDGWRNQRLMREHFEKDHPENHFSTGNLDTLGTIERDEFLSFYNRYYSAGQMALALTGNASLDQLESWVRSYFSEMQNGEMERIVYPENFLSRKEALRLIEIEPVKDIRELTMVFPLPALTKHFESKPGELLGFILGYEGKGSLLSYLKKEDLATGLGSSAYASTPDYGMFTVSVDLTPKGLKNYKKIISASFSFFEKMRKSGYPDELFDERATMARLDELYTDKGEGAPRATFLANQLRLYPMDVAEREPYLFTRKDPETYNRLVDQLRPENMLVQLVAKGLKTDKIEAYYGTKYRYTEEKNAFFKALSNPVEIAELYVPQKNRFIPSTVALLPETPVKLVDEPGVELYYSQDVTFQRPKVSMMYRIRQPRSSIDLRSAVLKTFYGACVNEVINEVGYTASVAGLSYSFTVELGSVDLMVSGYDESAIKLLEMIVGSMPKFEFSQEQFASIKDSIIRDLENFPKADAWRIARMQKRKTLREFHYMPDEQLPLAREVTLEDVLEFASELYARGGVEGLVHGNMPETGAIESVAFLRESLGIKGVADEKLFERRLLVQDEPEGIVEVDKLEVNNSCFWREYFIGNESPENRAAALILGNFVENPFYTEMRTRQQLGYIVWGQTAGEEEQLFAYFIVQSGTYPPDELQQRADVFLATFPEGFAALSDDQFAQLKAGVRAKVEEKEKSIAERAGTLFSHAYKYEEDWDRKEETLGAIDVLTRDRVQEILTKTLGSETRRMRSILLVGREHEMNLVIEPTFEDVDSWKKGRIYR